MNPMKKRQYKSHKLPTVTLELLEYLETIFPDKCPDRGSSVEDIYVKIGNVQVIRKLRSLHEEQTKNPLG